jgi:hypothetical protein
MSSPSSGLERQALGDPGALAAQFGDEGDCPAWIVLRDVITDCLYVLLGKRRDHVSPCRLFFGLVAIFVFQTIKDFVGWASFATGNSC